MRTKGVILTLALSSLYYSCGSSQKNAGKIQESMPIPMGAIIAVHNDENGNLLNDQDDLRAVGEITQQTLPDKIQEQDLPKIYEQAKKPEKILTKQQDVSQVSEFRGWLHYRSCPSQVLQLSVWTQQEPLIVDSCQAYHIYQPAYMIRGRAHRFFFHRAYRLQNMTYYYYVNQQPSQQMEPSQTEKQGSEVQQTQEQKKETKQQQEKVRPCEKQQEQKEKSC